MGLRLPRDITFCQIQRTEDSAQKCAMSSHVVPVLLHFAPIVSLDKGTGFSGSFISNTCHHNDTHSLLVV